MEKVGLTGIEKKIAIVSGERGHGKKHAFFIACFGFGCQGKKSWLA